MITLYQKVGSTTYSVVLPWVKTWGIRTPRPTSEKLSLAGSMIRQSAAKAPSVGTANYSQMVPSIRASVVDQMDQNTSSCILTDSTGVYEAQIDAFVSPDVDNGRQAVEIEFKIIRRILP